MFLADWSDVFANLLTPELVATIVGFLVVWWKGTSWYKKIHAGKAKKAAEFVEAGVQRAYETLVKEWKKKGRKLTKKQRQEAMEAAKDAAIQYAKENGMDLLKFYSAAYLPVVISRFVKKAKTESGK